jgi:hypothetical protein
MDTKATSKEDSNKILDSAPYEIIGDGILEEK